jgi:hypothetical protein
MARTVPIPAEQPLDATRDAAEKVVTLAVAEVVAVQVAASMTLAALLWPLIPAARSPRPAQLITLHDRPRPPAASQPHAG